MSPKGSRAGAIARAQHYLDSGTFEAELAKRVAHRTESQKLPQSLSYLKAYLEAIAPAFETMGFKCRTYDNPLPGQAPVLLATRIEDPRLPTVLGYGHGDVIRGQERDWTKGKGPWLLTRDGDRLYGRGTADNKGQHTINMAALKAVIDDRDGRLGFNAKYLIETGEEAGSAGLAELVRYHRDEFAATVLIASDGPRTAPERPTIVLGNRGSISFDLICNLRTGGHHSGNWGGLIADPAVILAHAIAVCASSTGQIGIGEWLPPPISPTIRKALADVTIDSGTGAPAIDTTWGEPGLSSPEKVYAWNSFAVLAMSSGNPQAPVNAIAPSAWARCQLRYVVGTRVGEVLPALRRHLDAHGCARVQIEEPADVGSFPATRTDPDHPWATWVAYSLEKTHGTRPAIIPSSGGGVPNDIFQDILGLPTIWIPHSYPACSQHAPDEHILLSLSRNALALMAGLYWDIGEGDTPILA
jgi:acetylornithine deacetylase/succinyl-diaminopimelate desuccinylase-like protein